MSRDYNTNLNKTIRQFTDEHNAHVASFLNTKLSLAAKALYESGLSWGEIAKKLNLTSAKAVRMMVLKYGGDR